MPSDLKKEHGFSLKLKEVRVVFSQSSPTCKMNIERLHFIYVDIIIHISNSDLAS